MILALIQFLTLVLPTGDPRFWMGPAYLFKLSSVAALLLLVYFSLRITNQEFLTSRFQPTKLWFSQRKMNLTRVAMGQISLLCLHLLVFLLLSFPLLAWAGAIEHAPVGAIISTLLLLFFYSLTYSMWGLFEPTEALGLAMGRTNRSFCLSHYVVGFRAAILWGSAEEA
jgi:hypothetical protein